MYPHEWKEPTKRVEPTFFDATLLLPSNHIYFYSHDILWTFFITLRGIGFEPTPPAPRWCRVMYVYICTMCL